MALKLSLKANEKVIIGGAVIRNGMRHHADLFVENNVPILRHKDIMAEAEATTPVRRLYFVLQLLYIDTERQVLHMESVVPLIRDIALAAPSAEHYLGPIREHLAARHIYQALKTARQLMEYEAELLAHASNHGSSAPLTDNKPNPAAS